MIKASWLVTFALGCSITLSCQKAEPAAYWQDFPEGNLTGSHSDQGAYGGHRAMHWQAKTPGSFSLRGILRFAESNGWKLQDSLKLTKQQMQSWRYDGKPIFPLSHQGLTDKANVSTFKEFPRWIESDVTLYKFKTGWVAIEPGTDSSTEENGFVMVDQTRTAMSVYHLWGE